MNAQLIAQLIGWLARISGFVVWMAALSIAIEAMVVGSHLPMNALLFVSLIIVGYPLACWLPIWGGAFISASFVWMNIVEYRNNGHFLRLDFPPIFHWILAVGLLFIAQGIIQRVHRRGSRPVA